MSLSGCRLPCKLLALRHYDVAKLVFPSPFEEGPLDPAVIQAVDPTLPYSYLPIHSRTSTPTCACACTPTPVIQTELSLPLLMSLTPTHARHYDTPLHMALTATPMQGIPVSIPAVSTGDRAAVWRDVPRGRGGLGLGIRPHGRPLQPHGRPLQPHGWPLQHCTKYPLLESRGGSLRKPRADVR